MKGTHFWKDEYAKKFPDIKKSDKGPKFARCSLCPFEINLSSIGVGAIASHRRSEKHKENVKVSENALER